MDQDFSRGQWRRIYSGAAFGRRINLVGDFTERLFWRIVALCDDYGNFTADPTLLRHQAVPLLRRQVAEIKASITALADAGLIHTYHVGPESFLHISGHTALQPAGANGRRTRRWPGCPAAEAKDLSTDFGPESTGVEQETDHAYAAAADDDEVDGNAAPSAGDVQTPTTIDRARVSAGRLPSRSEPGGIRKILVNPGESQKSAATKPNQTKPNQLSSSSAVLGKPPPAPTAAAAARVGWNSGDGWSVLLLRPLIHKHGEQLVEAGCRAVETRVAAGETVRNPIGLLRKMLVEGFSEPLAPAARNNPFLQEKTGD